MYRFPRHIVALGAAALACLLAAPAWAAGGYVVSAGGVAAGDTTVSGSSGTIDWTTSAGLTLTCDSGTLTSTLYLGPSTDGADVGTVDSSTRSGCVGPLGIPYDMVQQGVWSISLAGPVTNGQVGVTVRDVQIHLSNPDGQCDFDMSGSMDATLDTGAQQVTLIDPARGAEVVISNVVGCFGLYNDGDTVVFQATYDLTTSAGPIAVAAQ